MGFLLRSLSFVGLVVAGLWAVSTVAAAQMLPGPDSLQFTRWSTQTFLGVNEIVWNNGTLFLATTQDLFKSNDTGRTWTTIAEPPAYMHITQVATSGDTVYALGTNGQLHRTDNHGLTWRVSTEKMPDPLHNQPRRNTNHSQWTALRTDSSLELRHVAGFGVELTGIDGTLISDVATAGDRCYIARRRDTIECMYLPTLHRIGLPMGYLSGEYVASLLVVDSTLYAGIRSGTGNVHRIGFDRTMWDPVQNAAEIVNIDVVNLFHGDRGIYVCSREQGVLFIESGTNILRSISNGLRRSIIQTLAPIGSSFIIGSRMLGVFMMDAAGTQVDPFARNLPQSNEFVVATLDSTVFVVLSSGVLVRSADLGRSWETLDTLFPNSILHNLQARRGALYASTTTGVRISRDRGETWSALHPDLEGENVNEVIVGDSLTILIATSATLLVYPDGRIVRFSPNAGTTYPPRMSDAVFHDGRVYGVGYPGIFISADNGQSWKVHTHEKTVVFRTLSVIGKRLLVVTDAGVLLAANLPW